MATIVGRKHGRGIGIAPLRPAEGDVEQVVAALDLHRFCFANRARFGRATPLQEMAELVAARPSISSVRPAQGKSRMLGSLDRR